MLKRTLKALLLLTGLVMVGTVGTLNVWATDADYEVKAIPSPNQVDKNKTYFDLRLEPEAQENITIKVTNHSDQERTVKTDVQTATTNTNGVVEYINSQKNKSIDLPYNISELVKTETKEITLAPNQSKDVVYSISMPKADFSGVLSGGIIFTSKNEAETEKSDSDVAINNQFGYVIALVLHGKEEVTSDLQLSKVNLGQINNRNVIFAQLVNPKAAYLNRLNITAKIKKQNSDQLLYKTEKNNMQMAPNSVFNYPVSLQETEFKPGKYVLSIHAESKGRKWDFEEEFEIKADEAKSLNEQAYVHHEKTNYWWLIIFILVIIVLILLFMIYRKRQQKIKALEEQLEELKNKE